jgi:hypothetical protein
MIKVYKNLNEVIEEFGFKETVKKLDKLFDHLNNDEDIELQIESKNETCKSMFWVIDKNNNLYNLMMQDCEIERLFDFLYE